MTTLNTKAARANFSDTINRCVYLKEQIVLTRRGRPVCAIVPMATLEKALKALAEVR